MSSMKKDIHAVIAAAKAQGWKHSITANGHHQLYSPDKQTIVVASDRSADPRAFMNFMAEMKAGGYIECDAQSATHSLGDALSGLLSKSKPASSEIEELNEPVSQQRLTLPQIVTGFLERSEVARSSADIAMVVKHHRPNAQQQSIVSELSRLATAGRILRVGHGLYKAAPKEPIVVGTQRDPIVAAMQTAAGEQLARNTDAMMRGAAPASAIAVAAPSTSEEVIAELMTMQTALIAALGRVEGIIQRLRAPARA